MIIIGVDFHPEFQQMASVDTDTGEFQEKRLAHREDAEKLYRALAGQKASEGLVDMLGQYMAHFAILTAVRNGSEAEPYEPGWHKVGYVPFGLDKKIGKTYGNGADSTPYGPSVYMWKVTLLVHPSGLTEVTPFDGDGIQPPEARVAAIEFAIFWRLEYTHGLFSFFFFPVSACLTLFSLLWFNTACFEKTQVHDCNLCLAESPVVKACDCPEQSSSDTRVNEGRWTRISRCQTSRPAQPRLFIAPSSAKSRRKSSDSQ